MKKSIKKVIISQGLVFLTFELLGIAFLAYSSLFYVDASAFSTMMGFMSLFVFYPVYLLGRIIEWGIIKLTSSPTDN